MLLCGSELSAATAVWLKALDGRLAIWQYSGMKLSEYLRAIEMKPSQFAASIGVPASTIARILNEGRMPHGGTLRKIAEATGGEVMPNDFAFGDPQPEPREAAK